jgi:hypothetical protein
MRMVVMAVMEEAKTHYSLRYGRAAFGVNDAAAWLCRHGRLDFAAPGNTWRYAQSSAASLAMYK